MIKTRLKAPKGRKGDIDFESYSENKRRNPSPEEKRHDTGEKDFSLKRVVKGADGGIKHKKKFTKRGNTQVSSSRTKRKIKGKNEEGESSFSSDVKVVESGPKRKYKVKSSNTPEEIKSGVGVPDSEHWDSERHLVSGKQESRSKRTLKTGKKKPRKYKGKIRKVRMGLLEKQGY